MAAAAMIAALAAGGSVTASARTDLPDRTPRDVLAMVASHEVEGFSGRLEATVEVGLPQLPGAGLQGGGGEFRGGQGQDAASPEGRLAELLSAIPGTHDARVFADGHDRFRAQLLDGADEKNLVRNGSDLWFYDSAEDRAVHTTLPRHGASMDRRTDRWGGDDAMPTPERIADRLLEGAEEHSVVSVEEGTSDSGRDAYTLRLDPRTDQTLVDTVTVDVDAETGFPLGVEVRAFGEEEPPLSVAFTEFTPEAPDAGLFDFRPPAGATVEEISRGCGQEGGWHGGRDGRRDGMRRHGGAGNWESGRGDRGQVVGEGWDAVVVLPAGALPEDRAGSALLDDLVVEVEGGRLLDTPLLNVLLTDDGRVLAGSVPQQRLLDVAAETADEE